jgi:hypothetical protein
MQEMHKTRGDPSALPQDDESLREGWGRFAQDDFSLSREEGQAVSFEKGGVGGVFAGGGETKIMKNPQVPKRLAGEG